MVRAAPSNLVDDFESCAVLVNSVPPTPSPCSSASMLAGGRRRDLRVTKQKAPPPLNGDYFEQAAFCPVTSRASYQADACIESGVREWPMPFGLRNTCVDAVSLGHVEARMGQPPVPYSMSEGMQRAPPGILLQQPPQLPNAYTQHHVATDATQLPPPPPILPPQLSPDFFAMLPPAPVHQPEPEILEVEANVTRGAARATIEEAPRGSSRFAEGSGSLLAQQLAQHLNAEIVRSELKVKNTFIDGGSTRSPSLERLLRERRQVRSCPGSALPSPQGKYAGTKLRLMDAETISSSRASTVDTLESPESLLLEDSAEHCVYAAALQATPSIQAAAWRSQPGQTGDVLLCSDRGRGTAVQESDTRKAKGLRLQLEHALVADSPKQRKARVLQLEHALTFSDDESVAMESDDSRVANLAVKTDADASLLALAEATFSTPPRLGSAELPSVGSLGHHMRRCRPCAFVLRMGCSNGTRCNFCHLCNAGEKKRRRKEKRAILGVARKLAVETAAKTEMQGAFNRVL